MAAQAGATAKKTVPTNLARKLEKLVIGCSGLQSSILVKHSKECAYLGRFPILSLAKYALIPKLDGSFDNMDELGTIAMLAMGPSPQPGQQQPPFWTSLVPLGLLVVVFYFVLIRPQQKKAKDHAALLKAVRAGDKVVTTGGIVGVVMSVKEKTLSIRSADAKFEVTKAAIAEITERSGEPSGS
jgi:preprotein translocase subunit YajC